MEKEKISLSVDGLQEIVYNESEDYDVIKSETTGHWRHGAEEITIIQRVSDGKYFKINWRHVSKDECDFDDMNYDGDYEEVFPYEKTITEYR